MQTLSSQSAHQRSHHQCFKMESFLERIEAGGSLQHAPAPLERSLIATHKGMRVRVHHLIAMMSIFRRAISPGERVRSECRKPVCFESMANPSIVTVKADCTETDLAAYKDA